MSGCADRNDAAEGKYRRCEEEENEHDGDGDDGDGDDGDGDDGNGDDGDGDDGDGDDGDGDGHGHGDDIGRMLSMVDIGWRMWMMMHQVVVGTD